MQTANRSLKNIVSLRQFALVVGSLLTATLFVLALLWLLGSAPARAQAGTGVLRVATTGSDAPGCGSPSSPCRTVQYAVDLAQPGDEVRVASGVYNDVHTRGSLIQVVYVHKSVTLRGGYTTSNWNTPDPEANPTTLDAGGQGRVLYISGTITATVDGLRITGGDATGLGGMPGGTSDTGGGVYVYVATTTIQSCIIYSNTASTGSTANGGGVFLYESNASFLNNSVMSNTASTASFGAGGGLYLIGSEATLQANILQANVASTVNQGWGGGLALQWGAATLLNNMFHSNIASKDMGGYGGGLFFMGSDTTLLNNSITNNTGTIDLMGSGGGLYFTDGDITLQNNIVQSNIASMGDSGSGGGLYLSDSAVTLNGNILQSNIATMGFSGFGGGLYLNGTDAGFSTNTLVNNTVISNIAAVSNNGKGGGLYLSWSNLVIDSNTLKSNVASTAGEGYGGGIYCDSWGDTLEANTIVSNVASLNSAAIGHGGGLWMRMMRAFTLTNNLVADNHANTQGGGLWVEGDTWSPALGRVLHTTVADSHGSGQGIYVGPYTTLALTNTILAGHSAVGITATANSTVTLEGTLWHDNTADTGGAGTILTGTVNVYGDPAFTWNYHLGPDSAAIDAGVDAGVTVDIDGHPRPLDLGYDIGADEYMPMEYIFLPLVLRQ